MHTADSVVASFAISSSVTVPNGRRTFRAKTWLGQYGRLEGCQPRQCAGTPATECVSLAVQYVQATYLVHLPKGTSPEHSQMRDGTVIPCGPRILGHLHRRVMTNRHGEAGNETGRVRVGRRWEASAVPTIGGG